MEPALARRKSGDRMPASAVEYPPLPIGNELSNTGPLRAG